MSNILIDHVSFPLPSDTFDGPLAHDMTVGPYECPRCIAERAVLAALEAN